MCPRPAQTRRVVGCLSQELWCGPVRWNCGNIKAERSWIVTSSRIGYCHPNCVSYPRAFLSRTSVFVISVCVDSAARAHGRYVAAHLSVPYGNPLFHTLTSVLHVGISPTLRWLTCGYSWS